MRSLPLPLIRRFVPLKGLQEHSLHTLLEQCDWQLVGLGQRLFSAADVEQNQLYLLSGEASLVYPDGVVTQTAETLYPLGYGLAGVPLATASTDCVVLQVPKALLNRQLCWDQVASAIELELSYQSEHDDEASWRLTLLKSNLFQKVPPLNVGQIFSRLKPMQVKAGEVILRQGEVGDGCYFIRRGRAAVTRRHPGESADRHIVDIGYGRCFGEDALVYETVRNATVAMSSDGLLMRLDKADFMLLLREPVVEHIKASDLDNRLAAGAVLLDVRLPEEFDVARLLRAQNIPLPGLRLLMEQRELLQRECVVYCDTGSRSRAAVSLLQQAGVNARYLLNGMNGLGPDQRDRLLDVVPPLMPMPAQQYA